MSCQEKNQKGFIIDGIYFHCCSNEIRLTNISYYTSCIKFIVIFYLILGYLIFDGNNNHKLPPITRNLVETFQSQINKPNAIAYTRDIF